MTVSLEYIAAGGNRHSSAADWAPSLLAFGAGNNIALWDPEDSTHIGITALLAGHSDVVNAVKIYDNQAQRIIVSGGADSTIWLWAAENEISATFQECQCLRDHTGSVNTLAILPEAGIFVSGSADATLKVWKLENTTAKLMQSISLKPRYLPLALAITSLSNGDLVLAVAGTANYIQLYVRGTSAETFELQASLSGHEGWIRSLDFTKETSSPESDVLLTSASQDKYIRLWRFHQGESTVKGVPSNVDLSSAIDKKSLSNKAHQVGSTSKYNVTFEALLIGHEDWIYTARWQPRTEKNGTPAILSASADNSLAIWHPDAGSGLWVCSSRLGEISSQKGSTTATGSTGGFWIGLWQPQARSVVSLSRTGSWRKWTLDTANDMWLQQVGISGHVQEVQGLSWSREGHYLLTTSSDQTTRLLAEWRRPDSSSWHELARPQIHGYDLNCIDTVTENRFISGADEKLLRVFNKPKAVDSLLRELSGIGSSTSNDLPDAANIPVLDLSNKAMAAVDDEEQANELQNGNTDERDAVDPSSVLHKSALELDRPPFEDHLARHTLWPEHEKLYGHGYEISTVATSNDGSLVATACKASSLDHAVIRLYETQDWREIKPPLSAHSLTVTSLEFSPDDKYLLSVGRDRQWAIFERQGDVKTYALKASNPKGHSRMILDCSWAPQTVGKVFATAGRDKVVKIWRLANGQADCASTIAVGSSVTAVAFRPDHQDLLTLACGSEEGRITLVTLDPNTLGVKHQHELSVAITPCRTVNVLKWRPMVTEPKVLIRLAAASDDCSVRIYSIS